MLHKIVRFITLVSFLSSLLLPVPQAHAASFLGLPEPGTMISLSPEYEPVLIKGLKVHPEDPFLFDFIIDSGRDQSQESLKSQTSRLIKYFLAALTIPEKDLWVNLSPYEKNRMISSNLGQTVMGRDMLAQDYILKQLTASLIYPEKDLGKMFWDEIYAKARELYGTTQIPVNTFNKVWIVADRADVYEHQNAAYVVGAHLKVMLEEDYLSLQKHSVMVPSIRHYDTSSIGANIVRQLILPKIEEEVNTGKNFAPLRQMFYSMILASWYKAALKDAILTQIYGNKSKVKVGINQVDVQTNEEIFQRYLRAYKKGVFNYIKDDVDQVSGQSVPRKYFSGGTNFAMLAEGGVLNRIKDQAMLPLGDTLAANGALWDADITLNPYQADKAMSTGAVAVSNGWKGKANVLAAYTNIQTVPGEDPLDLRLGDFTGKQAIRFLKWFYSGTYRETRAQVIYRESREEFLGPRSRIKLLDKLPIDLENPSYSTVMRIVGNGHKKLRVDEIIDVPTFKGLQAEQVIAKIRSVRRSPRVIAVEASVIERARNKDADLVFDDKMIVPAGLLSQHFTLSNNAIALTMGEHDISNEEIKKLDQTQVRIAVFFDMRVEKQGNEYYLLELDGNVAKPFGGAYQFRDGPVDEDDSAMNSNGTISNQEKVRDKLQEFGFAFSRRGSWSEIRNAHSEWEPQELWQPRLDGQTPVTIKKLGDLPVTNISTMVLYEGSKFLSVVPHNGHLVPAEIKEYTQGVQTHYYAVGFVPSSSNNLTNLNMSSGEMGAFLKKKGFYAKESIFTAEGSLLPLDVETINGRSKLPLEAPVRADVVSQLGGPEFYGLVEFGKVAEGDEAMRSDEKPDSTRVGLKQRWQDIKRAWSYMPWGSYNPKIILIGGGVFTVGAIVFNVSERIIAAVDLFVLIMMKSDESEKGQKEDFMSKYNSRLSALKSFYETGPSEDGHFSEDNLKFLRRYLRDFERHEVSKEDFLELIAGVLSEQQIRLLKQERSAFSALVLSALDRRNQERDEFLKTHEIYYRELNPENHQGELGEKIIRDALDFYTFDPKDSDFIYFLTKKEKENLSLWLSSQLIKHDIEYEEGARGSLTWYMVRSLQYLTAQKHVHNAAMISSQARAVNGGIDLNAAQMQMHVQQDGDGAQMRFNPSIIQRIRTQGFDGLEFQIHSIVPLTNLPVLLGFRPQEPQLALSGLQRLH